MRSLRHCRRHFFFFSLVPRRQGCPKGFRCPRLPLCARRGPPPFRPFTLPRLRPRWRSSIHRIKLPCRRVHLAFYGLICLAATVTTSRKNDFYFRSRNNRHSFVQRKLSRASHFICSIFPSFVFSFLFLIFCFHVFVRVDGIIILPKVLVRKIACFLTFDLAKILRETSIVVTCIYNTRFQ